jgi:hypothetical protein
MRVRDIRTVLIAPLVIACGTLPRPLPVQPTERVLTSTPDGVKVAVYDVVTGGATASVKVWSNGIDEGSVDGKLTTLVHVGLELTNTGDRLMRVEVPKLSVAAGPVATRPSTRAVTVDVAPASVRTVETYFQADTANPQDIVAFVFHWALEADGHPYRQSTLFVHDPSLDPRPAGNKLRQAAARRRDPVVIRDGLVARK